jgi:hypothetical protein
MESCCHAGLVEAESPRRKTMSMISTKDGTQITEA